MAQVRIEAFVKDIQDNLYRGSEFLKYSVSHDQYVEDYAVHVPQAGSQANIVKNRASFPATIAERTDDQLTYTLDEYTTDPIIIRNIDKIQLSYDKRMSVMKNKIGLITQRIGDEGVWNWLTGANTSGTLQTTGAKVAVAAYPGLVANGATGFRLQLSFADIAILRAKMDRDNVPQTGRFLMIPSDMWGDFMVANQTILGSALYFPGDDMMKVGAVAKIFGFTVFQRPVTGIYAGGTTPTIKAIGAVGAPTDSLGALAWHEDFVAKAQGAVKFYAREDDPGYYGSYYSALVMFKATALRNDNKGVAAMVQTYSVS